VEPASIRPAISGIQSRGGMGPRMREFTSAGQPVE